MLYFILIYICDKLTESESQKEPLIMLRINEHLVSTSKLNVTKIQIQIIIIILANCIHIYADIYVKSYLICAI
jgi:hypothetical protein